MGKRKRSNRDHGPIEGGQSRKVQKLSHQTTDHPTVKNTLLAKQDDQKVQAPPQLEELDLAKQARRKAKKERRSLKRALNGDLKEGPEENNGQDVSSILPPNQGSSKSEKDSPVPTAKIGSQARNQANEAEIKPPVTPASSKLSRRESTTVKRKRKKGLQSNDMVEPEDGDDAAMNSKRKASKSRIKSEKVIPKTGSQTLNGSKKDNIKGPGDTDVAMVEHRRKASRSRGRISKKVKSDAALPGTDASSNKGTKAAITGVEIPRYKNASVARVGAEQGVLSVKTRQKAEKTRERQGEHDQGQLQRTKRAHEDSQSPAWRVSAPIGGRMLDVDPVFSRDQEYFLIAYQTSVGVYSTSSSLMVRRLQKSLNDGIAGLVLSPSQDKHLYVAGFSGLIELWDWTEGLEVNQWRTFSKIYSIVATSRILDSRIQDLIITVDKKADGPWLLSAHNLGTSESAMTDIKTLLTYQQPLSFVKVLDGGRNIVATSGSQLLLGTPQSSDVTNMLDLNYTWRIIDCPEWIASVDVRARPVDGLNKPNQTAKHSQVSKFDIVIGGLKGAIYIYEDLLRSLISREKRGNAETITSPHLHWHRNAVAAVKWSFDGNYIISGGQETVLVLWQLETGQKETLPHLGAPIESIVVSPLGSSYGIRLADNSTMILSTSELKPLFSVSGVQLSTENSTQPPAPYLPTVDTTARHPQHPALSSPPAAIAPSMPGRLLLAVPPSRMSKYASVVSQNASYLQTIDVASAQQTSRQAITRTKVTHLNMGPESNSIDEPNVTHMSISHDGQWLATVDEWAPPIRDVVALTFDKESANAEQTFREERFLKFWNWNETSKDWDLVSRIDNPHASESGSPYESGRVLSIAADPSSVAFATNGEDGIVRTWKPSVRRRHGLDVNRKDGKTLLSWHCRHATPIDLPDIVTSKVPSSAILSYSSDGSILAAAFQPSTTLPIHILDNEAGTILSTHTGLYSGPLLGLGLINRYLITLSHTLNIWDLITCTLHYGISLTIPTFSLPKLISTSKLAVNIQHNNFAFAIPEITNSGSGHSAITKVKARVAIFDPSDPKPLFTTQLPNTLTTLLPAAGRRGFYAIDSAAEIRTLVPAQSLPILPAQERGIDGMRPMGLEGIFGTGQTTKAQERIKQPGPLVVNFDTSAKEVSGEDNDAVVVSRDRLAEVFDAAPAFALPPMAELFEQVAGLYSGRGER